MANNNYAQWSQNAPPMDFASLEQEYDYNALTGSASTQQQQRQQQFQQQQQRQQNLMQQGYASTDSYRFQQQQQAIPPTHQSSSLHGAFESPHTNQQRPHANASFGSQPLSFGGNGTYPAHQQQAVPIPGNVSASYRQTVPASFNFTTPAISGSSRQPNEPTRNATLNTTFVASPGQIPETFPQASTSNSGTSYYNQTPAVDSSSRLTGAAPAAKRQRDDSHGDDMDAEAAEQKDAKSKLSRACARCKNLKVRCEAKTETEPCKRCFNGGHECVIPGRKIRKTPPKREHLLNEIQSQAREIERLMRELEKAPPASSKRDQKAPDRIDVKLKGVSLGSPVLSPSSTTTSLFGGHASEHGDAGAEQNDTDGPETSAADVNKAVADWIAKARDSLQEFGTFIGIGGAAMPKSYLVDEDYESDVSGDEEYVDVQEDLSEFGNEDDRYEVAVEQPGDHGMGSATGGKAAKLGHKSSASSLNSYDTSNPLVRKKKDSDSKPANLPVEASPFGLFGNMSLRNPTRSRQGSAEPEDEDNKGPGIANANFFTATPAPNTVGRRLSSGMQQWPAILTRGIVTPQEAEKLFKIYFDSMNLSVSLLDPVLYTAQRTLFRSPFLFTVVCAISSRFYTERPELYAKAMHFAQLAAGTALISGKKNVEMCQAYILLSLYPVPAKKWEDQRSWLYLGLAIRAATDLNLHLPTTAKPLNENHAREMLNRTRVWLNCFNLDRSTGSQYGKPPTISPYDYMANHSEDWWQSSPYNMRNFDIHLCAYNNELKVMAAFISKIYSDPHHPTMLNKEVDFEAIATATDEELKALYERWMKTIRENTDLDDPQNSFRTGLLGLAYSYARLVALSYGFQNAFGKSDGKDENPFLERCFRAASDVVTAVVQDVGRPSQVIYWRHGPEAQSIFITFAAAFLVKLLQPKFTSYISKETRAGIRARVQSVIDLLGRDFAIDDNHGPRLYSRFLEKLLSKPMAKSDVTSPEARSVPLPSSRSKPQRTKSSSGVNNPTGEGSGFNFASNTYDTGVYNPPSPATSNSLSPPPTSAAISFDQFAPMGGIDPFSTSRVPAAVTNPGEAMGVDFFQPPLPLDSEIMQGYQALTDPNAWNDLSFPTQFPDLAPNWLAQFQQNMDLVNPMYDTYMTGPQQTGS